MKKLRKFHPSEENSAIKKIRRAAEKRNRRKTPYPFGFEYRSDRK
tara:strand:- start:1541 stop:1675 length:135 start_codon:yes stop_codon:yes gene_type:complete